MAENTFHLLPGGELVIEGLNDLAAGRETVAALAVQMAAPRLNQLGLSIADSNGLPETRLYELLMAAHGDNAHSKFNALSREMVSFQRALGMLRSSGRWRSDSEWLSNPRVSEVNYLTL